MNDVHEWEVHNLPVKVTLNSELPLWSHVKLTGDSVIDLADPGDNVLGTLFTRPKSYPGSGGVETQWNKRLTVPVSAEVTAGKYAKIGTPDSGIQRYAEWDSVNDSPTLIVGMFLEGGTETAELLTY